MEHEKLVTMGSNIKLAAFETEPRPSRPRLTKMGFKTHLETETKPQDSSQAYRLVSQVAWGLKS